MAILECENATMQSWVYFTVQLFNFQEWPKINFSSRLIYAFLSIKEKKKKAKAISTKGYICMIWHKILRAKIIRNVR